ncbi:MAG: hypothetical protein IKK55_02460 [Clostridia bacterium]|nr:hypothetical protein [Clostridia bacterium]MBR6741172.1 hypothetical protein [Clostridia bacterium]
MTFKKIMLIFCIGLPVCIAARILQITLTIDYSNGFYYNEQKTLGNIMLFVIILVCVGLGFAAYKAYKTPEKPPETNPLLSVSSAVAALALMLEFFGEGIPIALLTWQAIFIKLMTAVCVFYFLILTLQGHLGIKVPSMFHIIPCVYAICRTVFTFIGISSLAVISDNILLVAAYCALMVFFINYGKLYNNLDTELNFRKILASGLTASLLCLTQSVSYILINVFGSKPYLHTDLSAMLSLLALGAFSIIFTVSHFWKTA